MIEEGYVPPGDETDPRRLAAAIRQLKEHGAGQASLDALDDRVTTLVVSPYAFSVHRNGTNQGSIATGTLTKILFTHEDFDAQAVFDTTASKYTPTAAGKYLIQVSAGFTSLNDGVLMLVAIYKNGAAFKFFFPAEAGGVGPAGYGGSAIIDMNGSTDNIEFYVYHEQGADATLSGQTFHSFATGIRIAA